MQATRVTRTVAVLLALAGGGWFSGCGPAPHTVERSTWFRLSRRDFDQARFTTHPEYLKSLAASYREAERYDDARDTYMDALRLEYGDDFEAQVAMGRLYEQKGQWNRAVAHYARARSIRPGHLAGWYHLHFAKERMTILPTGERADGYNPNAQPAGEDDEG